MATYYLSTSGSDGGSGAIGSPWATFAHALGQLDGGTGGNPGDTLLVRGGDYFEGLNVIVNSSGTAWTEKITIKNYPEEEVWVIGDVSDLFCIFVGHATHPQYIEFDGINWDGTDVRSFTIKTEAGAGYDNDHIRFQNCEIIGPQHPTSNEGSTVVMYNLPANPTGGGFNEVINCYVYGGGNDPFLHQDHGFYIGSGDNLFEYNEIEHCTASGIQFWNENVASGSQSSGGSDRNVARYNYIHDNQISALGGQSWGIVTGTGDHSEIYGNIITRINHSTGSQTYGIHVFSNDSDLVYNNTVYDCTGIGIYVSAEASNTDIQGNICFGNDGADYFNSDGSTNEDNNLFSVDPLFVNAAIDDYRLSPGSPGIDTANDTSATVSTDRNGTSRPQGGLMDMGALEKVVGVPMSSLPDPFTAVSGVALEAYSSSWEIVEGGFEIQSNTITPSVDDVCLAQWVNDSFDDDQFAEITLSNLSTGIRMGVAVRMHVDGAEPRACWIAWTGVAPSLMEMYKITEAGGVEGIWSTTSTFVNGDVLRLEADGSDYSLYKNGVLQHTEVDADFTSGNVGLAAFGLGERGDNFDAGNLNAGTDNPGKRLLLLCVG